MIAFAYALQGHVLRGLAFAWGNNVRILGGWPTRLLV